MICHWPELFWNTSDIGFLFLSSWLAINAINRFGSYDVKSYHLLFHMGVNKGVDILYLKY